jgi:hypothetical protein
LGIPTEGIVDYSTSVNEKERGLNKDVLTIFKVPEGEPCDCGRL